MAKLRGSDILTVLRGLKAVSRAAATVTEAELKEAWTSSSTMSGLRNLNINYKIEDFPQQVKEAAERTYTVARSLKEFSFISAQRLIQENVYQSNLHSNSKAQPAADEFVVPTNNSGIDLMSTTSAILLENNANKKDSFANTAIVDHVSEAEFAEETCSRVNGTLNDSTATSIPSFQEERTKNILGDIIQEKTANKAEADSDPRVSNVFGIDSISNTQKEAIVLADKSGLNKSEVPPPSVNVLGPLMANASKMEVSSSETDDKLDLPVKETLKIQSNSSVAAKSSNESEKRTVTESTVQDNATTSGNSGVEQVVSGVENVQIPQKQMPNHIPPVARKNRASKLSETSREISVPSSRIGRLASYGSLAAGLGIGALAEITRRTLGLNEKNTVDGSKPAILDSNPFLTEANAERIVNTLCKVRGAALKLGQMLSIQDNSMINPQLQKIFERVRQSADFMPARQMESVLIDEFGSDWRSKLLDFQDKPFAAASVGQVHLATLLDGREVAMKIQYPGVAKGIESDINNLVAVMNVWNILPKGMYIAEFVEVAKRELSWEVDYVREAECTKRFKDLVKDKPNFKVPDVIDELCTSQVFTSEFVEGISMEQCMELDQETRNFVAENILSLCLTELFEFRFMQTDPNWANFMYNPATRQIVLIDFGASREYSKEFVDKYIRVIEGAAEGDRQKVLDYSQALGFLVGYESKAMEEAHVDAVMILGEAFRFDKPFDFGQQDTTRRIQRLIPVMLSQRLCPPPQESYSLHRKMSGAFLLCTKLKANINCRKFFIEITEKYHASGDS